MTRAMIIIMLTLLWCLSASALHADIYVWEDEEGVMSFSNYSPPAGAKVFLEAPKRPVAEPVASGAPGRLDALEKKIVQQQEAIEERLAETNENLVLVIEKTEALVEELDEKVAEADRRAGEAAAYARGLADGLSAAATERPAPPSTVYVERNGSYPVGLGFVGFHGFDRRIHSGFHGRRFFDKGQPGFVGKKPVTPGIISSKSVLRDVDGVHSPKFRFSSTTSISPPRHDPVPSRGFFGKSRNFRR